LPRYYLTQVTAPTLQNDMYGVFLAKAIGAKTIAFGTHVTPMTRETMQPYPALDFVLRGEPEVTLRELVDVLEGEGDGKQPSDPRVAKLLCDAGAIDRSERAADLDERLAQVMGLARSRSTPTGPSFHSSTTCRCRCTSCCRSTATGCR
jgi:radical SAM superfamily enzyme YgiQ (UPF0313 family)